jgi:hypothetical protein
MNPINAFINMVVEPAATFPLRVRLRFVVSSSINYTVSPDKVAVSITGIEFEEQAREDSRLHQSCW